MQSLNMLFFQHFRQFEISHGFIKNLTDSGEEDVMVISLIFSPTQPINKTVKIKIGSFLLLLYTFNLLMSN